MKTFLAVLAASGVLLVPSAFATNTMDCLVTIGGKPVLEDKCIYDSTDDIGSFVATAGKTVIVLLNDPAGATAQVADPSAGLHYLLTGMTEQPPDGGQCWTNKDGSVCVLIK
jgi:hypothetical protein